MAIPNVLLQLARNNPMMSQIKQMMGMVRNSQNPTAMLNQIAMNNPNLKQVMEIVNQYNGDVSKAFTDTAEKMGVDPQEILNMMR